MVNPESRDQRELNVSGSLEVGASWLPLRATLSAAFRRLWDARVEDFITETEQLADTDGDALARRVEEDEGFADILTLAAERAIRTHDQQLRGALARLVAAAFKDSARIDTLSFVLSLVTQLEPVHLRILRAVGEIENPIAPRVEQEANAEPGIGNAALTRLQSLGLIADGAVVPGGVIRAAPTWMCTDLGRTLLEVCLEVEAN